MPGAIWLALIPYVASNCGVATYTVPVKLNGLCSGVPTWYSVAPADSSGTGPRVQAGGEAVHLPAQAG